MNADEIDDLMTNILPNITKYQIENMVNNLEIVNNKYFASRKCQMDGVLEILSKRHNDEIIDY